jgi:hypothetical protein
MEHHFESQTFINQVAFSNILIFVNSIHSLLLLFCVSPCGNAFTQIEN